MGESMIAFVLSGGGPRGALQAGALQVLFEKGIRPDMLVGTSAGAINAAYLACDPTPDGVYRLADVWRHITKDHVYGGGLLTCLRHLATHRDSFYCNDRLKAFLESHAPTKARLFKELAVRLYIVATDLLSGYPYIFGDDPEDPLLDAMMASSAMPPALPPWSYRGRVLVDGSVAANLPVGVAIEKGATEIYALDTQGEMTARRVRPNLWQVASWSIDTLVHQQVARDMAIGAAHPAVIIHHLVLLAKRQVAFDDFSQGAALIQEGREAALAQSANWQTSDAASSTPTIPAGQRGMRDLRRRLATSMVRAVRQ